MATRQAAAGGTAIERTTLLSRREWGGRQSVEYHAIREVSSASAGTGHRLSVQIDVDSYDFQSSARIQRWDGQTWQTVATIPYSLMACVKAAIPNYLALRDRNSDNLSEIGKAAVNADEAELVRLAALVLGF